MPSIITNSGDSIEQQRSMMSVPLLQFITNMNSIGLGTQFLTWLSDLNTPKKVKSGFSGAEVIFRKSRLVEVELVQRFNFTSSELDNLFT